jgi:hypothetical protein
MNKFFTKFSKIRTSFVLILFALWSVNATAQVNVTATAGTGAGSYATVNAAFTAINAGTHQGSIEIAISSNTTEPAAPTVLAASGVGTASYSAIAVYPTAASVTVAGASNASTGILVFNGADNITINGNINNGTGTTRNLTIQNNTVNTNGHTMVWFQGSTSSPQLGATNITIKNCNIKGNGNQAATLSTSPYSTGIAFAGTSFHTSTGLGANHGNISIINNSIQKVNTGIHIGNATASPVLNLNIRENEIGSVTPSDYVYFRGMWLSNISGGLIKQNHVFNIIVGTAQTADRMGIELTGTGSTTCTLERNHIHNLANYNAGGYAGFGIHLAGGSNHSVVNNIIYAISGSGWNTMVNTPIGIRLNAGTGHKVYYNSINLNGDITRATGGGYTAALAVSSTSVTGLDIRNNIFNNKITFPAGNTTVEMLSIWFAAAYNFGTAGNTINNNGYYITNDGYHFVGKIGTTVAANLSADLAAWQTVTGADAQSVPYTIINAPFTADDNLTIPSGTTTGLESGGVAIPALGLPNIDYTGVNRPAGTGTAPDIGAYEFNGVVPSGCSSTPNPGTAAISETQICVGNPVELSVTGYTVDAGIEIQWLQSSSAGGPFTAIPGATTPTYTTGPLTSTTYYQAQVTCVNGNLSAQSNTVSVIVDNPTVLTTTPGTRCGVGTVSLSATTQAGYTLNWYQNASGGASVHTGSTFTTPVISSSTTYYVAATTGGSTSYMGRLAPVSGSGTNLTTYGQDFTITQSIVLNSVEVISTTGTAITVSLYSAGGSTQLMTTGSQTVPTNTTNTISLGWSIAPGTYRIIANGMTGSFIRENSSVTYPFNLGTIGQVNGFISSITGSVTTSASYYWFYNWSVSTGCEGSRVAVTATVSTAPAINATTNLSTICAGGTANLSVTSSNGGYSYSWAPGGQTGSAINVNPGATTVYVVNANDNSGGAFDGCVNVDSITVNVLPASASITTSSNEICVSGSRLLSLNPATGYGTGTIQWQSSPDGISWTNIPSASGTTYTTPVLSSTTHYKAVVLNSGGTVCLEPEITLTVNNPQITSTTPGSRCGVGTVNLSATGPGTINWYDVASGGSPIGTGSNFTTPVISSTTNFYVSSTSGGGGAATTGMPAALSTATSGAGTTNFGLVFDALSPFTLNSVVVYPVHSTAGTPGTVTIDVIDGTGAVLHTATVNVTGYPSSSPVAQTVNLNFNILPGTNLKLRPGSRTGVTGLLFEPSASAPSGNYGYPYVIPGVLSINTSTLTAAPTNTPRNDLYYYFYNWSVSSGCEGPRQAVTASVITAPPISIATSLTSVCNGGSVTLTASSTNAYNYVWSPGGQTGSSIVVNPTATTTYTVNGSDNAGCAEVADIEIEVQPASASITTTTSSICISGSRVLSLNPTTGYTAGSIQWQDSPNGTTWTNIPGANGLTYTTPTLNTTTYYKAVIVNSAGSTCLQPAITLDVNNPQLLTTVPGTRCGPGNVNLSATSSLGSTINWYSSPSGGPALGTGTSFTTPLITSPTTFYAAASEGATLESAGKPAPTGTLNTTGNSWGLVFNVVSQPVTINSVKIYSVGSTSGSMSVQLTNSAGVVLATAGPFTYGPGSTANPTIVTLPVNFTVPVGTGYRMLSASMSGGSVIRESSGNVYPYTSASGNVAITSGYISGTSTTYYWFYDWQVSTGCESSRTSVLADVTPSPSINVTSALSTICSGNSTTVSVSSSNPNYTYSWTSNPAGFTGTGTGPLTVTPVGNSTTYQVYATDNSGGAFSGCGAVGSVTVNTINNPIVLTATSTPAAICPGQDAQLQAVANVAGYSVNSNCGAGFINISPTGASVGSLTDDSEHNFTFPFPFTFNGIAYTYGRVGTNGVVALGSSAGEIPTTNAALPSTALSAGTVLLLPFWDDLDIQTGATIQTEQVGSLFIIQFTNMAHNSFTTGSVTFQIQLEQGTNVVRFVYDDATFGNVTYDGGASATVGIQFSSTIAQQYSFNTASLSAPQCISYTPIVPSISYDWSANSNFLSATNIPNPVAQAVSSTQNYSVTVTDATTGCIKTQTVALTVNPAPAAIATPVNAVCEGDNIFLSASGGTTYAWYRPNGTLLSNSAFVNVGPGVIGVNDGLYTVVVGNSFGCTDTATTNFIVNPKPVPFVATLDSVSCPGNSDGSFTIGVNSGTPSFMFDYFEPIFFNFGSSANGYFDNLYEATYDITVTDINSCIGTMQVFLPTEVNEPAVFDNCPGDFNVTNDPGTCGAIVSWPALTYTDDCGANAVVQTAGLASGSVFPVGTTVNTFEVTDFSGETTICTFSVTVTDTENPTIVNCPADFATCNPVSWTAPTITDNCPGVVITSSHTPGVFPVGVTTVTYTSTDVYGNQATCSFDVTVQTPSVEADSITSNRQFHNICTGDNITLSIAGGSLGHLASWVWYSGSCGGTLVGTGTSITVAPTVTTTYFVRGEGACNNTICRQITVIVSTTAPGPVTFVTVPSAGGVGQSAPLVVSAPAGTVGYRYTSNLGHISSLLFNGQIGPYETTSNTVMLTFALAQQNYQIRVVAFNACGRANTASATIRGTVAAPTSITGSTIACSGDVNSYSVSPVAGSNYYTWSLIPATAGTITGQGGLNVTVTFAAGFTSAQLCVHGQTTFNLAGPDYCITISNSAPTPGAITGNDEPCQGGTENYTIAAVPGATGYAWTTNVPGASVIGAGTSASVTFPAGVFSGNICVTATTTCGVSAPSCFAVTSGAPGLPGPISGPANGICGATGVNYQLSTSDAISYNWTTSDPSFSVASGQGSNAVNVDFGPGFVSGTLTVEAIYACGSSFSSISVDGAPEVPSVTPAVICVGDGSQFFVASSTGATSFNWTVTGDLYSQCTNGSCSQFYVEWDGSPATLSVTATNACGTSAAFSSFGSCRVMNPDLNASLFPNPTKGMVTLEYNSSADAKYVLQVTDIAGKVIQSTELNSASGINRHQIDLTEVEKGLYMIFLTGENGERIIEKIVVE